MSDTGDGFDWRVTDQALRLWSPDGALRFEVRSDDGWQPLEPVEVHERTGRAGFPRCLRGAHVAVSGVCRPVSLIGEASSWRLEVQIVTNDVTGIGYVGSRFQQAQDGAVAWLDGCVVDEILVTDEVAVWLPHGRGAFTGVGSIRAGADRGVAVMFPPQEVRYDPA